MTHDRTVERKGTGVTRVLRGLALVLVLVIAGSFLWWAVGRWTAEGRRLAIHGAFDSVPAPAPAGPPGRITVLAWNVAHGRGDASPGPLQNWRGGDTAERARRLAGIARVLRRADADVVVLNEVDFDAGWSGGVDQAGVLAREAGYPVRVEQRNFDVRLPFASYAFGNAVLSRLPVQEVRWVELPPHSRLEALAVGTKAAALVRLDTPWGPVAVVPVHLEPRSEETRLAAAPALEGLRASEPAPLVLAGDFNTASPRWPGTGERTLVGRLLEAGWRSPRAEADPAVTEPTFPSSDPVRALDWILVEPPLRVTGARVLPGAEDLSDHLPVLALVELSRDPDGRGGG